MRSGLIFSLTARGVNTGMGKLRLPLDKIFKLHNILTDKLRVVILVAALLAILVQHGVEGG